MDHFTQEQAQPDGAGRNFRLRTAVGEAAGQQMQMEALSRVGDELAELAKVGAIHWAGVRPGGEVRH